MSEPANILIVDDLSSQRLSVEVALAELGENVVAVRSGREALKFLMDHEVAVVLLDVNMPEMDGFETASLIRRRARNATTPIIFLTADHDAMQSARGYALGAVDYLTCPFVPDVLRTKVKVFVALSREQEKIRREAEQRVAFQREQAARTVAEASSRRLRLLTEAGGVIMRSLDGTPFEDELLRILVPELADDAGLQFTEGSGRKRTAVWLKRTSHGAETVSAPVGTAAEAATIAVQTCSAMALDPDAQGRPRLLAVPIAVPTKAFGALVVARHGDLPGYAAEERDLMALIAGRMAVAIDYQRLFQELQDRDRRKDEFLAMLSHELRNPLGAITSAAGVLERIGASDDRALRATQVVTRQSVHLTRLIDDLLDVSRVTAGRITLNKVALDLRALADRTLDALRASGQLNQHQFAVQGEPVMVEADAARMEQVLTNLVINAIKYTNAGGNVRVEVEADEERARLRVIDDGIGIEPELLRHLFDVFVQGDQALDRAQGGLGLGLTLVRRLTELQGGTVRAFSDGPGKGSMFSVELPRLKDLASTPNPGAAPEPAKGEPLRILVVEDNDDVRGMLRMHLELEGHQVHEALNGPEAVEVALKVQPDVALLDLGLPGFDGFEVARRLHAEEQTKHVVLIALTGYGQNEDRRKTASMGFAAHLVKPVSPDRLSEELALAISKRGGREPLAAH